MSKQLNWNSYIKFYLFGFLISMLLIIFPVISSAEENSLNFYVTPIYPDSQVDETKGYFDLNLNKGDQEVLALTLQNATNQEIQIEITAHTAYTNVQGVVEYGKDDEVKDTTLSYSLNELIATPEVITLKGNETQTIEAILNMPNESFEGILAGGLKIREIPKESETDTKTSEGLSITNEFSYVIGVVVSNERSTVIPNLELLDVFADQLNYRNVISATIQNFMPTFVNRLSVEATIHKKGDDTLLYEASQEQMQMAPNSHFDFPISLNGDRFNSGTYILNLTAHSGDETWTWTKEFTIDGDEARSLNRSDVTIDTSINWWIIGLIGLIILLLACCIYLFWQKKKINKEKE